jgi:hypothetical protein
MHILDDLIDKYTTILDRDPLDYSESTDVILESFAKEIIRECANQVNSVYKQGGGTYAETILKHFDIK